MWLFNWAIGRVASSSAATTGSTSSTTTTSGVSSSAPPPRSYIPSHPLHAQTNAPSASNTMLSQQPVSSLNSGSPMCTIGQGLSVNTRNWHQMIGQPNPQGGVFKDLMFYRPEDGFFEFANTYKCRITVDGISYPSTEHYFQCQGYGGPTAPLGSQLCGDDPSAGADPMDAVHFARNHRGQKIHGWNDGISNHHMRIALQHKFSFQKHPALAMLLMETWKLGHHILVENSDVDPYWGAAPKPNGSRGDNKLGIMLMERRKELQSQWYFLSQDEKGKIYDVYKSQFPKLAQQAKQINRRNPILMPGTTSSYPKRSSGRTRPY